MKKIIVAIDSFKGCLTSAEANQAAAEGILQPEGRSVARNLAKMPEAEVVQVPVSDGGEGWLEAFYAAMGGSIVEVNVKDPLMRTIVAQYLVQGDTAVIEIAKALLTARPSWVSCPLASCNAHESTTYPSC